MIDISNNTKIRYNTMNIKVFVKEEKRLEQWDPRVKAEFPMNVDIKAVLKVKKILGLQEYENVNYLPAIKRILGMESLPE